MTIYPYDNIALWQYTPMTIYPYDNIALKPLHLHQQLFSQLWVGLPEIPEAVRAGHKEYALAKEPLFFKANGNRAEEKELAFDYLLNTMKRITRCFEVVGDVEEVLVRFDPFQAHQSEGEEQQAGEVKKDDTDAEGSGGRIADVLKGIRQHGYGQRTKENDPEDRYEELVKQCQISGDPMH